MASGFPLTDNETQVTGMVTAGTLQPAEPYRQLEQEDFSLNFLSQTSAGKSWFETENFIGPSTSSVVPYTLTELTNSSASTSISYSSANDLLQKQYLSSASSALCTSVKLASTVSTPVIGTINRAKTSENFIVNQPPGDLFGCRVTAAPTDTQNVLQRDISVEHSISDSLLDTISNKSDRLDDRVRFDLLRFLENDPNGRLILLPYKNCEKLTTYMRQLLVHILIDREKDLAFLQSNSTTQIKEFKIPTEKFPHIAEEIRRVFPKETRPGAYFTKACTVNGVRISPSGKLYDRFTYIKGILRDSKILADTKSCDNPLQDITHTIQHLNDDEVHHFQWLKENIEPWTKVVTFWDKTFTARRAKFISEQTTVEQYFNQYRCLSQELGADLLKADFEKLYPGAELLLFTRWGSIRDNLFQLIKSSKQLKNIDAKVLISRLKELTPGDQQDALLLYLLPHLIKPTRLNYEPPAKDRKIGRKKNASVYEHAEPSSSTNKKKNTKLTVVESQEAFIMHVENATDLEEAVRIKAQELKKKTIPVQPFLIFVGPITKVETYYVYIWERRYKVQSPLHALDLAFKSFFALECRYPEHCFHLWLFIQKVGYDIENLGDKFGTALNNIIGQFL